MVAAKICGWNVSSHSDYVTLDEGLMCLAIDMKPLKLPDLTLGKKNIDCEFSSLKFHSWFQTETSDTEESLLRHGNI